MCSGAGSSNLASAPRVEVGRLRAHAVGAAVAGPGRVEEVRVLDVAVNGFAGHGSLGLWA